MKFNVFRTSGKGDPPGGKRLEFQTLEQLIDFVRLNKTEVIVSVDPDYTQFRNQFPTLEIYDTNRE